MTSRNTISWFVKYGLHFVGIWPGTPFPGLRKVIWVVSTVFCLICQYKYLITHVKTDGFIESIYTLSITLPFTLLIGKLVLAWINHGVLREIISTMEDDCTKYAAFDRNNVISKTADLSFRLTSAIPAIFVLSVCCNAVGTLAIPQSNGTSARQLLIRMDLPFDTSQSPTYELVVAGQIIFEIISAFTFGMISSFLMMTILHAGCVIDILCYTITHISSQDEEQFRFVAMRHQEIIQFTQRIERMFTYIALGHFLTNTLIICCLEFLMITALQIEDGLPIILKSFFFYVAICSEIFMYCCAGEYLNTKSKMIVDAICDTCWYDLQPTTSRRLVLFILKSQKGLPLTFGKFASLNLDSFANIMKASASYMSVLLAMT